VPQWWLAVGSQRSANHHMRERKYAEPVANARHFQPGEVTFVVRPPAFFPPGNGQRMNTLNDPTNRDMKSIVALTHTERGPP